MTEETAKAAVVPAVNPAVPPCVICESRGGNFPSLQNLAEIAAGIPVAPSLAAAETVYERRIKICGECESLRDAVLCAHCGCFVLFRARAAKSQCPHPRGDKWNTAV
ncbi:hypothetical protein FACS1894142_1180 [Spirochaetia bacterium]|nr:hypothetical protein FACS1894142_1180 [Spirochaetia bacterium]